MEKNEFKEKETAQEKGKTVGKKHKKNTLKLSTVFKSILNGEILTRDAVVRLMPFVLYVVFLLVLYIANTYSYEKKIRKTNKLKDELIELEYEYITIKSEWMHISKQSELARRLDSLNSGIKESIVPPVKILEN